MYLEHFGLREFPFSLAPDPRYLFLSAQHQEALAHLLYGLRSEGGFVQVTGEVGTGKTTVCRCFLEQLPEGTRAAVILNPRLGVAEMLEAVCDEFEITAGPEPATVKGSLDRLNRFLLEVHAAGGRAVLVVDEAQNLDAEALEQVRLLTNLETSRHKLLQIVLMGQPELRLTLARPELRQLAQRVTARFHLGPLSPTETAGYVRHRMAVAGGPEGVFPAPVLTQIARQSGGIPRVINILADRALLGAFVLGHQEVDAGVLRRAAREVAGETGAAPRPLRVAAAALSAAVIAGLVGGLLITRNPGSDTQIPPPAEPSTVERPHANPPPAGMAPDLPPNPSEPAATASVADTAEVAPAAGPAASPVVAPEPSPQDEPPARSPAAEPAPVDRVTPVIPPVFGAILQLPETRREEEAWGGLFRLWGITAAPEDDPCTLVARRGLLCLRGEAGWEEILRYDRPAIVQLEDAAGPAWLLLESVRGNQATFAAGRSRTVIPTDRVTSHGPAAYALIWRPPAGSDGIVAAGERGGEVAWLRDRLVDRFGTGAPPSHGGPLEPDDIEVVRRFQREAGLVVDGIPGPRTLLLLDQSPEPGTPRLAEGG